MEKPELRLKKMIVEATIPVRGAGCCGHAFGESAPMRATFSVDTETWECEGQVTGLVVAPTDWWKGQCAKVSERVKEMLA